ncbi:mutarotase [Joostella atrarenae]|uniref:Mutarotase n=1 Tax=Joostella atrarenae TaxID=679257 RepID=A0ABS9J193_9FLAO|nr:mutarotase [Joostella atrarenae]
MNLKTHYSEMYEHAKTQILADNYQTDSLINNPTDKRRGITLVIRPNAEVKANIEAFLKELKLVIPNQYFYPETDVHITVMSIISCYNGFRLTDIDPSKYISIIKNCISEIKPFKIDYKGITASPSGIMVQGFTESTILNDFRDRLRADFKSTTLEQSLDKRYAIKTSHVTIARFLNSIQNTEKLISFLDKYRNYDFGSSNVDAMDLVHNDWYMKNEVVESLHHFKI